MLPPRAMDMGVVQMMEIANVMMVSTQLTVQVNFLWKYFIEIMNALFLILSVEIVECDAAHNCSSQGICGPDGACDCDLSFYGDNCISKLRKICDEYLVDFKTNMFSFQTFS